MNPSLIDDQPEPGASTVQGRDGQFATTHWSAVLTAGEDSEPAADNALQQLCATYWYPLYAYVRRQGYSVEDAQDLTQDFFSRFLARRYFRLADRSRGRFRTFLLTSLKHFLINEFNKVNREKRGGGRKVLSIDEEMAESRLASEPAIDQATDAFYDRGWAGILLERAMAALRAEFEHSGKRELFERLKVFVWGEKNALTHAAMADQLGLTEGAVKVAVHRLRQRYGGLLRAEVARTVTTPVEVEEELRYLLLVIRNGLAVSGNLAAEKL